MSTPTRIAVIGAGNVGGALGRTFSKAHIPVRFGVKPEKDVKALLETCGPDASSSTPTEAAAWADVVFLAVPGSAARDVAASLKAELAGKIVVDCNNPLVWKEGPVWSPPQDGSLAAAIARVAPGARVVKAFNTFGAEHHANPVLGGAPAEVFIAGDDASAKASVSELATKAGFAPVDAGPLRNAAVLENLAMLWIHLATVGGKGRDFTFALQRAK